MTTTLKHEVEVRRIDEGGRVLVGDTFAGKSVRVEVWQDGVFLRFVDDLPEGAEWWLKDPAKLRRALEWKEERSPIESAVVEVAVVAEEPAPAKAAKGKRGARDRQGAAGEPKHKGAGKRAGKRKRKR